MKIEAKDIRVGNYLEDHNNYLDKSKIGKIVIVDDICWNGINGNIQYGSISADIEFEYLKGILLTPEILNNAGFTNDIEEEIPEGCEFLCFFKDNIDIEMQPGKIDGYDVVGVTLYEDAIDEDGTLVSECKYEIKNDINYLHQLQNLYFCLTGQELNIEL